MNTILTAGTHPVTVTDQPGAAIRTMLKELSPAAGAVFILCDEQTHRHCLPVIQADLPGGFHQVVIGSGERNKNIHSCNSVWEFLLNHQAGRDALLINIGGGMVTDLGGFAASVYKRGIRFLNVPTSLLAMVDASCGGKTGIDLLHYKNMIGLFSNPQDVVVSPAFLDTLPGDEWKNGMAEMLKHGLIADAGYWKELVDDLYTDTNNSELTRRITRAIEIKASIVERDPHEKKERKLLNFGHTIGHALETWSLAHDDRPMGHGMAVACGMICETFLSGMITGLTEVEVAEITRVIADYFKPALVPRKAFADLMHIMQADKKATAGSITFALLAETGRAVLHHGVDAQLIHDSMVYFNSNVA